MKQMKHIHFMLLLMFGISIINACDSFTTDMILIPGGYFTMGSTSGPKDEQPAHRVYVDSFYIGITEVTVWEYLQCVQSGDCRMPYFWNKRFFAGKVDDLEGKEWLSLPVTGVSWEDAQSIANGKEKTLCQLKRMGICARVGPVPDFFWETKRGASQYAVI